MLLLLCFEAEKPNTEVNAFKCLRKKESIYKDQMGWNDVILHSFNLNKNTNETNLRQRLKLSLTTIQHYNKREEYKRILIFFDNDVDSLCNKFLNYEQKIYKILEEEFINLEKGIHKIEIPHGETFEYFLTLFCKNKKNDFALIDWEQRKKINSKLAEKIWESGRINYFKENVKKYRNDTNWGLLFKEEI